MEQKDKAQRTGKGRSVIGILLLVIFLPVLLVNIAIAAQSFVQPSEVPQVFGIKPLIVETDSMRGTIEQGDLILIRECDPATLTAGYVDGDIITFRAGDVLVTHRAVEMGNNRREQVFITKGDGNNALDPEVVTYDSIEGKYILRVPKLGAAAMFMQTPLGLALFVGLPVVLFIVIDGLRVLAERRRARKDN